MTQINDALRDNRYAAVMKIILLAATITILTLTAIILTAPAEAATPVTTCQWPNTCAR